MRAAHVVLVLASAASAACSLLVSTSGLSGDPDDAATPSTESDGPLSDASTEAPGLEDAASDSSSTGEDAAGYSFFDDFTRPNSNALGNGWFEKSPSCMELLQSSVVVDNATSAYQNCVAIRPQGEDVADVEVTADVTMPSSPLPSFGYPMLAARVDRDVTAVSGQIRAYLLYFPDSTTTLEITREEGASFTIIGNMNLTEPVEPSKTYRMMFRVTGSDPVSIQASLTRVSDQVVLGTIATTDLSATRITGAGSVGFGASEITGVIFDRFTRRDL